MGNEFEEYLRANRERLEKGGPSAEVWGNIEQALISRQQKKGRMVRMRLVGWSVAAGLILGIGIAYLAMRKDEPVAPIVKNQLEIKRVQPVTQPAKKDTVYAEKPAPIRKNPAMPEIRPPATGPGQSIDYYARLVAEREQQFKQLKSLDPGLYNESQKVIAELNATYNQLQSQLKGSVNRQKVVEMMIQNLQMQEKILGNQLQLIHDAEEKTNSDEQTL